MVSSAPGAGDARGGAAPVPLVSQRPMGGGRPCGAPALRAAGAQPRIAARMASAETAAPLLGAVAGALRLRISASTSSTFSPDTCP